MSWNDGYERKKFMARMKKQAEEYRAAGMTEEQIQAMYEFDLGVYKSDRNYYSHTQEYEASDLEEGVDDSDNALLNHYLREFSVSYDDRYFYESDRYGWIECIEHPELAAYIKSLPETEKEIITLHVYEDHDLKETARIIGLPHVNVWRRFERIKKNVFEIFSQK